MASEASPFGGVTADRPQLLVWRVERLKLKQVSPAQYGFFYRGDAYVVYSASEQRVAGRSAGPILSLHVHFWLGSEAGVDEAEVAALSAMQLDKHLGGRAVQHREMERYESPRFRYYFMNEIRYLEGGFASGLRRVDTEFKPKLYLVKGHRRPVIRQLPEVSWCYFNDGDAYVISTEKFIFIWCGTSASGHEKLQAAKLAQSLRSENPKQSIVIVISGEESNLPTDECLALNAVLPLDQRVVKEAEPDSSDQALVRRLAEETALYVCSGDESGVSVSLVKTGGLCQDDLVPDDVFIVDPGDVVWLWVGKRAATEERVEGLRHAEEYLKACSRPGCVPVCRIVDGAEPPEFKCLFGNWSSPSEVQPGATPMSPTSRVAPTEKTRFDASMLHNNAALAMQTQLVDDGSGRRDVYRVENGELAPVPMSKQGTFFAGDCYVIQYMYKLSGKQRWIIYFWLGAESAQDERGIAALKTVELDEKLGGRAVQVRVVQGKEPPHFMAIFNGRIVVHSGGKASSFDGPDTADRDIADTYLLQVRCTSRLATRAIEVPLTASSLNSNDAFILRLPGPAAFVWIGNGSVDQERAAARTLALELCPSPTVLCEGDETSEFWACLGGRADYASTPRLRQRLRQPARLFQCSNASGCFRADEVFEFDQQDLCEDDVMLLDAWEAIWLWVGSRARADEKQQAKELAVEYLRTDPANRGADTTIYLIQQGAEPPHFTGYFGAWSADLWARQPSWTTVRKQLSDQLRTEIQQVTSSAADATDGGEEDVFPTFPLAELQGREPPEGVDPTHREAYLSPDDFKVALGATREEFKRLPTWKQVQRKRAASLF